VFDSVACLKMKYLLSINSIILNVAVGQIVQSVKIAVGEKCRRSKWQSVKNSVGQNGRRSNLRRSKDLEPISKAQNV
jgi:hypothetical protein